jgi:hypothetical protein
LFHVSEIDRISLPATRGSSEPWSPELQRHPRSAASIIGLSWIHVDLKLGAIELASDEQGREPGGSWRVVPLVKPLWSMLRKAWGEQGRPTEGKVFPPRQ